MQQYMLFICVCVPLMSVQITEFRNLIFAAATEFYQETIHDCFGPWRRTNTN